MCSGLKRKQIDLLRIRNTEKSEAVSAVKTLKSLVVTFTDYFK